MSYLQNPLVLAAVAILSLLVLALIVLIILRSRGRNQAVDETRVRQELEAMERENQFATAVERLEYRKSSTETAADVAGLFADHLSLPLYAIYAGREGEDRLTNILPKTALLDTRPLVRLPDSLPSSVAREFRQPQTARVSALTGLQAGELPAPPSAEGQETAAGLQQQNSGGESQENAAQGSVAVLPWRGSFGWGGLMIARAGEGFNAEALSHYREPLARLSNALAVALEMERERGEAAANDWRVLGVLEFSRSVVSALDKPSPLAIINSHLPGLFRADSAAIWSVDRNTAMVRAIATYGLGATEFLPLPMGQGLAGIVAQSGQPLAVEDAPSDPRCLFPREAQEAGIVSYLGAPMIVEGNTIGVVEVHTSDRRVWSEGDARLLASVASLLAEVVRGTETRSNKLRVENAYLGLSEALQRLRSHDEVLAAVVEVLGHALGVSRAFVIEFNELGQPEAVEYEYRLPEVASVKGTAFREDLLNRVMATSANGGPILIEDSRSRSLLGPEAVNALNVYSEMALPVKVEGQTRALIYLHQCDAAREWQPSEVEFAMRVGQQLSLSLGNARAFESLTHEAEAAKEEARRSKEARARAQAIIEALPEPLIAADAEGRLALYNLTARDRLGLRNEDVGQPIAALEQLATQDDALWERVLSCEGLTHFTGQIARAGATANPLPVSIAVTPMRNERGNISGRLILLSDISHVSESPERGRGFEQRLAEARATIERLQPLVNEARAAAEEARRKEMEIRKERDQLREDQARVARSAQQLIEINRLKSEFIVNAGHEIEGPLQALLGLADQLEQGNYGQLTQEQLPVVQGIKEWARRLQEDVNSLIEYGSTRSRREDGT